MDHIHGDNRCLKTVELDQNQVKGDGGGGGEKRKAQGAGGVG